MAKGKKGLKGWQWGVIIGGVGVAAVALLSGGGGGGKSSKSSSSWSKRIMEIIKRAGKNVPKEIKKKKPLPPTYLTEGDVRWKVVKHDDMTNIESITYLGQNDDVIWPGSIIKGTGSNDFVYKPVLVDRAPLTMSVNLETSLTGKKLSEVVKNPGLSTIRQGVSDLLSRTLKGSQAVPLRMDFALEEVFSASDMSTFIGADIDAVGFELQSAFDWSRVSNKTRIVGKYQQIYYSIDVDKPQSPDGWFSTSLKPEALAKAMPAGSFPVYVSTIQYGMMAIIVVESDYSKSETEASINAAFDNLAVNVGAKTKITAKDLLRRSKIKTLVYGGSSRGLEHVEQGIDGFLSVIKAAAKTWPSQSPGVPLTYKFRNMLDNTIAKVALTSQWSEKVPFIISGEFDIIFHKLEVISVDEGPMNNTMEIDLIKVWAWAWIEQDYVATKKKRVRKVWVTPENGAEVYKHSGAEIDLTRGESYPRVQGTLGKNVLRVKFPIQSAGEGLKKAKIRIKCFINEVDDWSADDYDTGEQTIGGLTFDIPTNMEGRGYMGKEEVSESDMGTVIFHWEIRKVSPSIDVSVEDQWDGGRG